MAKQAPGAAAPGRRRRAAEEPELIDWREPAQNARVLDWRQRAEAFGLNPIGDEGGTDGPIVVAPDLLIGEEEPEATAPLGFGDVESVEPVAEDDEPVDPRLPAADTDPVRVYLQENGRRKLLTSAQEQEIGGRIEAARAALLAELPFVPRGLCCLLSLADTVRRGEAPAAELILLPGRRRADAGTRPAGAGRAGRGRRDDRGDRGRRTTRRAPGRRRCSAICRSARPPSTPSSPSCGPRPRRRAPRKAAPRSIAWRSAKTS